MLFIFQVQDWTGTQLWKQASLQVVGNVTGKSYWSILKCNYTQVFLSLAGKDYCCCNAEAERSCAYILISLSEMLSLSFLFCGSDSPNRAMEMTPQELRLSPTWFLVTISAPEVSQLLFSLYSCKWNNCCFDKNESISRSVLISKEHFFPGTTPSNLLLIACALQWPSDITRPDPQLTWTPFQSTGLLCLAVDYDLNQWS